MASATAARSRVARFDDEGLVTGEAVTLDVRPASALIRAARLARSTCSSPLLLIVALLLSLAGLAVDEAAFRAIIVAGIVGCIVVLPDRGRDRLPRAIARQARARAPRGARRRRCDRLPARVHPRAHRRRRDLPHVRRPRRARRLPQPVVEAPGRPPRGHPRAGRAGARRLPSTAFGVPAELVGWAATADVARLPDVLARRVASFFGNVDHLVPESRARVAASLAAQVAPFVSPLPDAPPERFLAAVVALRRDPRPHGAAARGRAHGRARAGAHGEAGGVPRALTVTGCREPRGIRRRSVPVVVDLVRAVDGDPDVRGLLGR